MDLADKLKMALDESRLLILGAQVIFGCQFQMVFQERFQDAPRGSQTVQGIGLLALVTGEKGEQPELLHQGIPLSFKQSFNLADHVKVVSANVEHGLLMIDLMREVPEQLKPRRIEIRSTTETKAAQQDHQSKQIDKGAQKAA
jgi:hypothetical protein